MYQNLIAHCLEIVTALTQKRKKSRIGHDQECVNYMETTYHQLIEDTSEVHLIKLSDRTCEF